MRLRTMLFLVGAVCSCFGWIAEGEARALPPGIPPAAAQPPEQTARAVLIGSIRRGLARLLSPGWMAAGWTLGPSPPAP